MEQNKAVEIGTYFEQFISDQVASGRFASDADVLQAGLRLLEEQQTQFMLTKSELSRADANEPVSASNDHADTGAVSHSVTDAMRALASASNAKAPAMPVIPSTKGLLRSRIAAE